MQDEGHVQSWKSCVAVHALGRVLCGCYERSYSNSCLCSEGLEEMHKSELTRGKIGPGSRESELKNGKTEMGESVSFLNGSMKLEHRNLENMSFGYLNLACTGQRTNFVDENCDRNLGTCQQSTHHDHGKTSRDKSLYKSTWMNVSIELSRSKPQRTYLSFGWLIF